MLAVAFASIVVHGAAVSALVVAGAAPERAPSQEVAVEVVQEVPKPLPPAKPAPQAQKSEPPRADLAKPEPPKPEVPPPKREAPNPPPPKAADAAPAKPPPLKPSLPPADDSRKVAELQKELDALKAERAALERADSKPQGAGPMTGFDAAALPSIAADGGDGEAASYEALVFSQLAKAKGIGARQGRPGTAGVRFEVDDAGHLVNVDVVVPSGVPELDAEAIAVVKRAAPFLPPPKGAQHVFMANFNFVPQAQ